MQQQEKNFSTIKGSLACLSSPGRANYDFHTKLGEKLTLKKRTLGRLEELPTYPGYPFYIVGSNYKQGFLGWNHHIVILSNVSLMLSYIIITLIRGNTK